MFGTQTEQQIYVLEARVLISELRSRYCWYTTRGDRESVVNLFTKDCRFVNHRSAKNVVTIHGRENLFNHLSEMKPGRRIPMVMNEITSVYTDTASGTCVMYALGEDPFCGHYEDTFKKVDDDWLFSSRSFYPYSPIFRPSQTDV